MLTRVLQQMTELIASHPLMSLGVLLLAGYLLGRLARLIRLPSITGYIVAGLLVSDSVAGLVSGEAVHSFTPLTEVALAFIAFTIGGEFQLSKLRRTGLKILVVTLFEAMFAFAAVLAVMRLVGQPIEVALLLGAIAAATAPAATVIIVRELKARGEFVDYLFGVVAFDDAVSVLLFSGGLAVVAPALLQAGAAGTLAAGTLAGIAAGFGEIGLSALFGVGGALLIHIGTRTRVASEALLITLALLFTGSALVAVLHLSPLISNMCAGAVLINLSSRNRRVFEALEPLTPPIFALFFILAGAELDIAVFAEATIIILGLVYLVVRFAGKLAGVTIGSLTMRAPRSVRRYLGYCLFPQAGVAIGLALTVQNTLGAADSPRAVEIGTLLVNVVLLSVFINELIGPLISRFGVTRGAEVYR